MFGFDVRNKWHWFTAAGICFFLAWFVAYAPSASEDRAQAQKPVATKVLSVQASVFPTRTATKPPTAWRTPTWPAPTATPAGTTLCPAGEQVPAGAPMWVTATGTSFSQSGIYKFAAEGQNAGTLTGREELNLCETSVQGGFGAVWHNPAGGK